MFRVSLRFIIVLLLLVGIQQSVVAQRPWEQYLDMLADVADVESAAWESAYEDLCELEEHPMDVNTITREDLERFPFLNDMDIAQHRKEYSGNDKTVFVSHVSVYLIYT